MGVYSRLNSPPLERKMPNGWVNTCILRDITERKRVEWNYARTSLGSIWRCDQLIWVCGTWI